MTLTQRRNPPPLSRVVRHAERRGGAVAKLDAVLAVDRGLRFTADELCPLFHHPVFATLPPAARLRYNQLVGLLHNEIICFFEQDIGGGVLPALLRDASLPPDLRGALRQFLEDEQAHTATFRALNRAAEPAWYGDTDFHLLRLPATFRAATRKVAAMPRAFPFVFWVMLLMEERSLFVSKRMATAEVDPAFAAVYRAHLEDEVRHVQTDWHLLERFWASRPAAVRRGNAKLLEWFVAGLFLRPRRANVRLVDVLVSEFPDLRPRRDELASAARSLAGNNGYRRMMYSPLVQPSAHDLMSRRPELAGLLRRLAA